MIFGLRLPSFRLETRNLFSLTLGALCAVGAAQAPKTVNTVAPQFRTAPRSLITEKVDKTRMVPTTGALNPIVNKYADLGEADANLPIEHIQILLQRPAERQAAFDAAVEALHVKGSPSYHKWLVPETVGTEFGPSSADVATVVAYLQSEGFTVNNTGKSGLYIDFTGTAAQVEKTFQTKIHTFDVPADGSVGVKYSAVQQASIPEALAPAVVGLVSLSNVPSAHTNYRKTVTPAPEQLKQAGISVPGAQPLDTVSTTNYAVAPQDFYTIYNETPLLTAATPINGTGVTIALLEESAITTTDVTYFRNLYNVIPNTPASFVVDTGYGSNTCTAPAKLTSGEEGEAILDIQWAGSVAPGANLIFMQCAAGSILGVFYSAEAVIDNNIADVMSLSYGQYEGYNTTEDTLAADLWEQAASQGETVVVSAGDSGAAAEDGNYGDTYAKYGVTASSFSTTAWNVSAGGTDFEDEFNTLEGATAYGLPNYWNSTNGTGLSSAKSYVPEMTWNDTCGSSIYSYYYYSAAETNPATFCGANVAGLNIGGGGGAPSKLHARPTWQTSTVYGLPTTTAFPQRLQPDVSLFASNGFWYHSLPNYESDNGGTSYAGGTSFVAPQLAGVFALIQQKTGERQGQPNYVLYGMAGIEYGTTSATSACNSSGSANNGVTGSPVSASTPSSSCIFYDITAGTSSVPCKTSGVNCYYVSGKTYGELSTSATGTTGAPAYATNTGWDQATGIGSMNITNLVNSWTSSSVGAPQTPTVVLTATSSSVPYDTTDLLTATVSGTGSFPTGSVTFSGASPMGTFGTATLVPSSGCTTAGTCTETATLTSGGLFPVGSVTLTATYSSLNENYTSASGTTSVTVTSGSPPATVTVTGIPAQVYGGVPYTATVTVAGGASFLGAVLMSSTDSLATFSPQPYTYVAGDAGVHTFTVTFASSGTQSVTASAGATSGSEGSIKVITDYPWVVNTKGTVVKVNEAGTALTPAIGISGTAGTTGGAAIDFSGNVWSVETGNNTLDFATKYGTSSNSYNNTTGYTYYGGGLSAPSSVAVDGSGYVWIANSTGNTVSEFGQTGLPVSTTNGFGSSYVTGQALSGPAAIVIDNTGGVWVASKTTGSITHIVGAAAPVVTPTVTGVTNGTLGSKP